MGFPDGIYDGFTVSSGGIGATVITGLTVGNNVGTTVLGVVGDGSDVDDDVGKKVGSPVLTSTGGEVSI